MAAVIPGRDALVRLLYWSGTRLAAQLCGGHSRRIMAGESLAEYIPVDLGICRRIQVNHETPDPTRLVAFRNTWGAARCIAQTRGVWLHGKLQFPGDDSVDWLFDTSRGGGVAPPFWPSHPGGDRLVGYAGGIGPGNILSLIEEVGQSGPYWIDMETSVRSRGRLDLYLCRRVCEMVYGDGL